MVTEPTFELLASIVLLTRHLEEAGSVVDAGL